MEYENFGDAIITHNPDFPTIYLIGDSHAGHYGALMTNIAAQKEFNFIMHPRGDGLKLSNRLSEKEKYDEYIMSPLRKYKDNFKRGDVIIFSDPSSSTKIRMTGQSYMKLFSIKRRILEWDTF